MEEMKLHMDAHRPTVPQQPPSSQQSTESTRRNALSAMGELFGNTYRTARPEQSTIQLLQNEMIGYEQEPPIAPEDNPLPWWENKAPKFPNIARLAKKYLAIPGSSVRSERVFSTAGNIVNKKRSALSPENVDCLVFLSNNL